MAMTAGNEHVRALQKETEKSFARWHNDLEHQATWLESNQLSDFLTAPVQGSQNAFDVNFEAWQLEINHGWKPPVRKASVTIRFRHWCLSA